MSQKVDETKLTAIIENGTRIRGRVMFKAPTGYGFISCKDIPFTRIFFHWSALELGTTHFSEIKIGDFLEFELLEHEDKGLKAIKIVVIPRTTQDDVQTEV